jgi:hypothetical protein
MRILLFPGASLMQLTPVAGGLRVRCPGCGHTEIVRDNQRAVDFRHRDGRCPVLRRLEAAERRLPRQEPWPS